MKDDGEQSESNNKKDGNGNENCQKQHVRGFGHFSDLAVQNVVARLHSLQSFRSPPQFNFSNATPLRLQ